MIGVSRSAFAAAWITKGRYVRFTPSFFALARTSATLCMSTSAKMWTWGEVCLLRTMWSAIFFRIGVHGTTWSPSAAGGGDAFGAPEGARLGGAGGRRRCRGPFRRTCGGAPPEARYPSTSFRVTRPSMPVPGIFDRSRPCSAAIRATTGVIRIRPVVGGGGGGGADGSTRGGAGIGGPVFRAMWPGNPSVSSSHFGAASGAGRDAAGSVSSFASTARMGTVSPGLTRICATRPADGEGISASTLSVEISSRGWSLATSCPHLHEPLHHDPFHHAFPELGHHDVDEHRFTLLAFNTRRVSGSPR